MPDRNLLTTEYYPDEMTLHEYVEGIKDAADGFEDNLDTLKEGGEDNKKFIEEWHEMFGNWCEIFNPNQKLFDKPLNIQRLIQIYREYGCIYLGTAGADFSIRAFYEEVLNELGIPYD